MPGHCCSLQYLSVSPPEKHHSQADSWLPPVDYHCLLDVVAGCHGLLLPWQPNIQVSNSLGDFSEKITIIYQSYL